MKLAEMLDELNESDATAFAEAALQDLSCAESCETTTNFLACITDAISNAQLLIHELRKLEASVKEQS